MRDAMKWIIPVAIAAAGAIATSATASFKASEAYDAAKELSKESAANGAEHRSIMNALERIEKRLDRLSKDR